MQRDRIDIQYRLTFASPFHFGTGLRSGLINRSLNRDRAGRPFVPGSTIKGVLRDQATQIAQLTSLEAQRPHAREGETQQDIAEFARRVDVVGRIFGTRYRPGRLYFDDARLDEEDHEFYFSERRDGYVVPPVEVRTQVSMSRRTGTARQGLLFSTEYGVRELRFDGRIYGSLYGLPLVVDIEDPKYGYRRSYSLCLLVAALQSLERLGGNKSAGAGVVQVEISRLLVNEVERELNDLLDGLEHFSESEYRFALEYLESEQEND